MKKILRKTQRLREDLKKALHKILRGKKTPQTPVSSIPSQTHQVSQQDPDWFPHESF